MRDLSYWEIASKVRNESNSFVEFIPYGEILIVGAGFCGSWLAYFLKQKYPNINITMVERDFLSLGASTRNAGFLSCGNISEWLEDLEFLGWENGLRTLEARLNGITTILSEFGARVPVQYFGSVDYDELTDEKKSLMAKFNEFLTSKNIKPFFEIKKVKIGNREREAAFNSFDMQVNPCDLLLRMHDHLKKSGVKILWHTNVEKISQGTAVVKHEGALKEIKYRYAFVCANGFAKRLNPVSQVEPARGQILVTAPCRTTTTKSLGFLKSGYDYFRFIDDRLLVGGGRLSFKENENTDRIEGTAELKNYLMDLAEKVIGHKDFVIEHHWSGIMGMRRGQHASFEDMHQKVMIDEKTEEIAGCGGWGVTLSPYIAKLKAVL